MEVPMIIERSKIAPEITFKNPGKQEGKTRTYTSLESVNGYADQLFTDDDCPDTFCGLYVHEDVDPGNGKLHPSYLTVVTQKSWKPYGYKGWNAWRELGRISRTLLASEGFAEVRAATVADLEGVDVPKGKFWLASPTFKNDNWGTHFYMTYVSNGEIKSAQLFRTYTSLKASGSFEYNADIYAGILAVVTLNTVIKDDGTTKRVPWMWK